MKLLILAIFAFTAVLAVEDYNAPEWQPIDWSKVIDRTEVPGFWDNTVFAGFQRNVRDRRIVGGEIVVPHTHPYQVALLHTILIFSSLCGGSVIAPLVVLTAAHCPINTSSTTVIAGAHNMNTIEPNQQRRTVSTAGYRIHQQYNSQNLNNDIATLIVPTAFTFGQFVAPIALAASTAGDFAGQIGQSTGFGRIADGGGTSPVMRSVTNPIVTNAVCAAVFGTAVVNHNVICIDTHGGRGTCQGDSGGVLSVLNAGARLQVGVTSFGATAGCQAGFPAGFERVSTQRSWIDANMS